MKIALYTGMFRRNFDGVSRCLHRLVKTMAHQGHEVFIASPVLTYIDHPNLTFYKINSFPLFFYPQYEVALPDMHYIQSILEYRPDLVHISTPDAMGLALYFFAKRFRIPVVFIHHSDINRTFQWFGLGFLHNIVNSLMKIVYNGAIATFVPTSYYQRELRALGIKRVGIWSRGVDHKVFSPEFRSERIRRQWGAPDKKIILYAGRLVWNKRLDILVKVYQKFQRTPSLPVQFVLVGEGPIHEKLARLMPEAIFTGFLEGRPLGEVIASGDIFLFPSDTDTFGQVVQEAITCGLPCVVSDVGGCQEIVRNADAGIVISNNEADGYFQACLRLLNDPSLLAEMRQSGIKYSVGRSWDTINKALISQYQRIIKYWQGKRGYIRYKRVSDAYKLPFIEELAKLVKIKIADLKSFSRG